MPRELTEDFEEALRSRLQPRAAAPVLPGVKLHVLVFVALATPACGGGDTEPESGLATGACLSGQQCAAGLVCASDVCVDLGGSGDDGGEGQTNPSPMTTGAAGDDNDGGHGSMDDGPMDDGPIDDGPIDDGPIDDGPIDDDASNDTFPDDGVRTDDGGAMAWCPVLPARLSCTETCDAFQFECYRCPHEPGDLCTYYDYQYEVCLGNCESTKSMPGDLTYEIFACRQFAGNDCGDVAAECLIEIDCSGA